MSTTWNLIRPCAVAAGCTAAFTLLSPVTGAGASGQATEEQPGAQADASGPWRTEYFYIDPRPDELFESSFGVLAKDAMSADDRHATIIMLGMLFEQYPHRTAEWMEAIEIIPEFNKPAVWQSLALANTDDGVIALTKVKESDPGKTPTIDHIIQLPPRDIVFEPINFPYNLTELWAAFFMTGDEEYVRRVITALEWAVPEETNERLALVGGTAYWSLARNAHAHSRVLRVCREEMKNVEGRVERSLRAVIAEAEKQLATTPCPEPAPRKTRSSDSNSKR